jgi:RNase P/RNase MRP subunit p29
VKRPIIEQEEREADGISGGKVVEEEWKALRIEGGQFQKETLPREGFDRTVQVETLEAIGRGQERLDTTGGNPAALEG